MISIFAKIISIDTHKVKIYNNYFLFSNQESHKIKQKFIYNIRYWLKNFNKYKRNNIYAMSIKMNKKKIFRIVFASS